MARHMQVLSQVHPVFSNICTEPLRLMRNMETGQNVARLRTSLGFRGNPRCALTTPAILLRSLAASRGL